MNYKTLRWAGIVFPALMVGVFETIRHEYLERILPGMIGNVATAVIAMGITFLFYDRLFRSLERINRDLSSEQRKSSLLEERDRIAREMHDGMSQSLFFLNIKLKSAQSRIRSGEQQLAGEDIEEARSVVSILYSRVRQTIYDLRTAGRDHWTLDAAIQSTLNELREQNGIATHFEINIHNEEARRSLEAFHLMRIAREAIYNSARHGNPDKIQVRLDIDSDGQCILEVRDDGRGFDVTNAPKDGQYGLAMMQERAGLIGADFWITSSPGKGTIVRVSASLKPALHQEEPDSRFQRKTKRR